MKPEDINVNDTYYARLRVDCITSDIIYVSFLDMQYNCVAGVVLDSCCASAISPINAKNAQKYDPCRPFKAGDRVQVKKRNGRCNGKVGEYLRGAFCKVAEDEALNELVRVYHNSSEYRLDPAYLELVEPVEELERYVVIHNDYEKYYEVCWKDDDEPDGLTGRTRCLTTFWYHNPPKTHTQEHAKAAAEAECDRLNTEWRAAHNAELTAQNAEYRKEQDQCLKK